jgi:anthranilate phosphoribosyltransferase
MKNVGPIRRELGVKTFFNMLGPLVNPSFPTGQMVGVYSLEVARLYYYLFQDMENFKFDIIHSLDGYDEISLTGDVASYSRKGEQRRSPSDLGFEAVQAGDIFGGKTVEEAAGIFVSVLKNEATEQQKNVVLVNAATAINVLEPSKSLSTCVDMARESLASGKAFESLKKVTNSGL